MEKAVQFAIRATANCSGFTHAMELARAGKLHFKRVEKGKDTYIAEIPKLRVFSGSDKEFRFLLVKERKRVKKVRKGRVFYTYLDFVKLRLDIGSRLSCDAD
jgi:hypothetical protein